MIFDNEKPVTHAEAQEILKGDDIEKICRSLVAIAFYETDKEWAEGVILSATRHSDIRVSGLAVVCIGHLARISGSLSDRAIDRVREALSDENLSGSAGDAWDDIRIYISKVV